MSKKMTKKRKTKRTKKPTGPTMEQRMADVRKVAEKVQKTWPLGALHVAGNANAIVFVVRPSTPLLSKQIMHSLTNIQADLVRSHG